MANVFEELAEKLKILPKEVEKAYLDASKKAINEEGFVLYRNLKRGTSAVQFLPNEIDEEKWDLARQRLNANLYQKKYETPVSYVFEVDWKDKIVNEDIGVNWGAFKGFRRASGKRNYSKAPATYHDFAYIISEGRVANFSKNNIKIVKGTRFIRKAWRNAQKWKKKRVKYFDIELVLLSKKFNEEDTK